MTSDVYNLNTLEERKQQRLTENRKLKVFEHNFLKKGNRSL